MVSIHRVTHIKFSPSGYYIHGAAPGGQAEGTAEDLRKMLELESKGELIISFLLC